MLPDPGQVKEQDAALSPLADHPSLEVILRKVVAEKLGETRFNLWFGEDVRLKLSHNGSMLSVHAPSPFFSDWIRDHFADSLIEAAAAVTGRRVQLAFVAKPELNPLPHSATAPESEGLLEGSTSTATVPSLHEPGGRGELQALLPVSQVQPLHQHSRQPPIEQAVSQPPIEQAVNRLENQERARAVVPRNVSDGSSLPIRNPRRLSSFVTGSCNQLAYAAAKEMITTAGAAFNPLLIHGGVGLGKSHLLEAIAQGLQQAHPGWRVLQTTAESFTNAFLEAMRAGALSSFRTRYRGAGALAIDDIHFFAGTRATQGEFLHTFNALSDRGAPIILTADQHPRQITRLTEELITRFLGGMIVKLEAPDAETRRAILQMQVTVRGANVPDPVLDYIAQNLRGSVRELEGALASIIVQATLGGKRLDLAMVKSTLRDLIRHTCQAISLRDIERAICQLFRIDAESLRSDSRTRALAYPRMLAMYLARKHSGAAYAEIGRYFGGRNHSTVISAERKVEAWLQAEARNGLLPGFETVADVLADLEATLGT